MRFHDNIARKFINKAVEMNRMQRFGEKINEFNFRKTKNKILYQLGSQQ